MKKLFLAVFAVSALWSCEEDFNTVDTAKELPVVYALLDAGDTAHYVRVERAFIDPKASASTLAQDPDNLYYDDLTVTLTTTEGSFQMTAVDGENEGYPRDASGPFATSPNRLYKIKASQLPISPNEEVTITLMREGDTKSLATASTNVVGAYELTNGTPDKLNFAANLTNIAFRAKDGDVSAHFYDISFVIHYDEKTAGSDDWVAKSLVWVLDPLVLRQSSTGGAPSPQTIFQQPGNEFYSTMANNLAASPSFTRNLKGIDMVIRGGSKEIFDYVSRAQANTGITGTQALTPYTNLSKGLGIFASKRSLIILDYDINDVAKDSLLNGSVTKKLNFID